MGAVSMFWVLCVALSFLSLEALAVRRNIPHSRIPTKEFANFQSSHEHLLGGAGCEVPLPP